LTNCTFTLTLVHLNNITTSQTVNFVGNGTGCGTATGTPPPPLPISISGRVTNSVGVGVVGVTVQLNGTAQGTMTTDGVGNYGFGSLSPGSYSVALTGPASCTITPSIANVNSITTNVVLNFAASGTGCTVGGTPDPTFAGSALHVLFELPDYLGSTTTVVDKDTSEVVERGTYMAYGETDSDYRPARWDSFREDYRFTGKEEDVEVGLQYFGKRFYAPGTNRWMSADPQTIHTLNADANVYAYVHGAVLRATDPFGLDGNDASGDDSAPSLRDRFIAATRQPEKQPEKRCGFGQPQEQEERSEQEEESEKKDPALIGGAQPAHAALHGAEHLAEKGGDALLNRGRQVERVLPGLTEEGEATWRIATLHQPYLRSPRMVRAIKGVPHVLKGAGAFVGGFELGYWGADLKHAIATGNKKEALHASMKLIAAGASFLPYGIVLGPGLDLAFEHLESVSEYRSPTGPLSIDWKHVSDFKKLTTVGPDWATAGQVRFMIEPMGQPVTAGKVKFEIFPIPNVPTSEK
jgi:RHS repeat-associated protein